MLASEPIPTRILTQTVARMQRTHELRRASFFVGPPGIGKSTAVAAFRAANPDAVMVTRITKRGVTPAQALQSFMIALRERGGWGPGGWVNSVPKIQDNIQRLIEHAAGLRNRDDDPASFPKLTIVFDEAQRLTSDAIDALRDWNEPHGFCAGMFPIGLIFVGNNELSLEVGKDGSSILDEGMEDRLLYRKRLSYDDVPRADIEAFVRASGINDSAAVTAIGAAFSAPNTPRSFRRLSDFIVDLQDQAGEQVVTLEVVRETLAL